MSHVSQLHHGHLILLWHTLCGQPACILVLTFTSMETLQVNSVNACFENMVMDRLHTLEEKHMQDVAELKQQNNQLACQV